MRIIGLSHLGAILVSTGVAKQMRAYRGLRFPVKHWI